MRPFAHTDRNNLYASFERAFNPSMIGRPVIVLGKNDGCAIARSNEAKVLLIKMVEPASLYNLMNETVKAITTLYH